MNADVISLCATSVRFVRKPCRDDRFRFETDVIKLTVVPAQIFSKTVRNEYETVRPLRSADVYVAFHLFGNYWKKNYPCHATFNNRIRVHVWACNIGFAEKRLQIKRTCSYSPRVPRHFVRPTHVFNIVLTAYPVRRRRWRDVRDTENSRRPCLAIASRIPRDNDLAPEKYLYNSFWSIFLRPELVGQHGRSAFKHCRKNTSYWLEIKSENVRSCLSSTRIAYVQALLDGKCSYKIRRTYKPTGDNNGRHDKHILLV